MTHHPSHENFTMRILVLIILSLTLSTLAIGAYFLHQEGFFKPRLAGHTYTQCGPFSRLAFGETYVDIQTRLPKFTSREKTTYTQETLSYEIIEGDRVLLKSPLGNVALSLDSNDALVLPVGVSGTNRIITCPKQGQAGHTPLTDFIKTILSNL